MGTFNARNGYVIEPSGMFNGVSLIHYGKARLQRGGYKIVSFGAIETLWGFFKNPAAAVDEERVRLLEPNLVKDKGGVIVHSVQRSQHPSTITIYDDELSALREYHDHLGGRMPDLPA